jgi:hypothetical protein
MSREPIAPSFADANGRAWDRRVAFGFAALFLLAVVFALVAPQPALLYRITDDAYYYFQVARNVVLGHGLTFDGVNETNGFHPLWMVVLVPVFAIVPNDPDRALRLVFVVIALVAALAGWAAYRAAVRFAGRLVALAMLPALASPFLSNPVLNGLETGLLVWLLYEFLNACEAHDLLLLGGPKRRDIALGLWIAALFLCRLDSVFLVFGLLIVWLARLRRGEIGALLRKVVVVGLTAAVPVGLYLAWSKIRFGHFVPISGQLKSTFPVVSFSTYELGLPDTKIGELLLGIATVALAIVWLGRRGHEAPRGSGLPALVAAWIGACLHFVNRILFMNWAVHWWHYTLYGPVAWLASALAVRPLIRRRGQAILLASVLAIGSLGMGWLDARHRGVKQERWIEAALWARAHLPRDAVVGMTDCGLFGYLSERRTINLDGVINSFAYWQALRERRLDRFLAEQGVTHFACHAVQYENGVFVVLMSVHVLGEPNAALLTTPDAEVYRSAPYSQGLYVVWDARKVHVLNDVRDLPEQLARLRR